MSRNLLYIGVLLLAVLIIGCGQSFDGQLRGVEDRPRWTGINPYGMVYIPSGTLHIGQSDEDIFNSFIQRPRTISIPGFYMDDTEITNNEYRQFVYWVRDSIAHTLLDHFYVDERGEERLDWEFFIDWNDEMLEPMFIPPSQTVNRRRAYDVSMFNYEYRWIDWQRAAHDRNATFNDILNIEVVNIYPDTLVWIRDFAYSYNEPMTRNYFSHPAFDDYPVVGVSWKMAKAFSYWRTQMWDAFRPHEPNSEDFRLPTEFEWEYAARGGRDLAPFPWGAYNLRNAKGCLMGNFKPGRGNYPEDGGMYTVNAYMYFPNDYGLYNMAGNVAEWTETAYFESAYSYIHDLSPDIKYDAKPDDPESYKRKVVRGGSWKDIGYYLQTGTRSWEYQDTTKSYIGFRNVLTFLGRSIDDF
ncbi:MAG: gliding motility-associated lipoprotein [Saprospirales bacterium]|jgi:sulfatase modifying factor 1|nr:MAG: gliding motility-associated lipoprotein [Saprospirales bacterium]